MKDGTKVPLERVFFTVANDAVVIRVPIRIPRWSGKAPLVSTTLLRSPGDGQRALLDAGTDLNNFLDELFSLMLTGAFKAVHNITWFRSDYLANRKQLSNGVPDGEALEVENMPPGADPMGTVETGKIPAEVFSMYQVGERAFAENVWSNMLDLSGQLSGMQSRTPATAIMEAKTAIGDIFESLAVDIDEKFMQPSLEECFYEIMQHSSEIPEEVVRNAFGPNGQDAAEQWLQMTPQERFADAFGTFRFVVKGLAGVMANAAKAQSLINYLNTLTANPVMMQVIETQISVPKMAIHIAKLMGLDEDEFAPDAQERALIEDKQRIREQAMSQAAAAGRGGPQAMQPGTPSSRSQPQSNQPGPGGAA
jgi:hypothetical protein